MLISFSTLKLVTYSPIFRLFFKNNVINIGITKSNIVKTPKSVVTRVILNTILSAFQFFRRKSRICGSFFSRE